jgi:hypothetical protein
MFEHADEPLDIFDRAAAAPPLHESPDVLTRFRQRR